MTAYFDFQPASTGPFQFQPTLDGSIYTAIVVWNLFGQRYYVNLYSLGGALVFSVPLIGSPVGLNIETMTWSLGTVTVQTIDPHGYKIGTTLALNLSGCAPDPYNGDVRALVTAPDTITFPLAKDPGSATALGVLNYNISLAAGYFTSSLVFRLANQQFEVNP